MVAILLPSSFSGQYGWKETLEFFEGKHRNIHSLKQNCISLLVFWCNMAIVNDVDSMLDMIGALHTL